MQVENFGGTGTQSQSHTPNHDKPHKTEAPQKTTFVLADFFKESPVVRQIASCLQLDLKPWPSEDHPLKLQFFDSVEEELPLVRERTPIQQRKVSHSEEAKYPKNIIKNFMVKFHDFLSRSSSEEPILSLLSRIPTQSSAKSQLSKIQKFFSSKKKISNTAQLQEMLSMPGSRELFIYFLQTEAEQWINRSQKLQLKQLHKFAIPYLKKAAYTGTKLRFPIKEWMKLV